MKQIIFKIAAVFMVFPLLLTACNENEKPKEIIIEQIHEGGYDKPAKEFTAEDYSELTSEEKATFPDLFDNMDEYNEWYDTVINKIEAVPEVDLGGKAPEEFTSEDYNDLTPEEKAVFPDSFENLEDYNNWYDEIILGQEKETETVPKVDIGEKEPEEFTKENYEKLTPEEKAVFPDSFASMKEYNEWYERVIGKTGADAELPEIDFGGKEPDDITFEEYNKLTPAEKAVFPDYFDSMEDYNDWYNRVVAGKNGN